jgi:TonB-linked SusC/RagA family outer membrane protein
MGSGAPLSAVTVTIPGTRYAALSAGDGRYVLAGVPAGIYAVEARRLGYGMWRRDNVRVGGETMTVDIALNPNPLSLQAVTIAATVDPTSGIRSPFAVNAITAENMPVPSVAAASTQLIGKIAGVHIIQSSGAPGAGSFVQLRSPHSPESDNGPLWVVDGVLLNENQATTTQDIEALNIASVEVIKGAAAAALYGSRAAGGVISITTHRGRDLRLGQSQVTVRNYFGYDQFHDRPEKRRHHWYLANAQGQFVDTAGTVVPRARRTPDPDGMADNPYPVVYDNIGQLMKNGQTLLTSVSVAQNSAGTNYNLTYTRNRQAGILADTYGALKQGIQFALDHSFRENLTVGITAHHSRSNELADQVSFGNLFAYDPDVDLTRRDAAGNYLARPDSASTITNPLYLQQATDSLERRSRTLVSANANFRPFSWLTFTADVGYDRGDRINEGFTPPGLPDSDGDGLTLGTLQYQEDEVDGLSGTLGATLLKDFGRLTTRLTGRGESQRERNLFFRAVGTNFLVDGVKDLAGAANKTNASGIEEFRVNAGMVALGLDYGGKYITDMLLRREGNSLFGRAHRWTTFYRVGGSYLVTSEGWWPKSGPLASFSTFKLRYNVGTAGTRPNFDDQYASIAVGGHGFTRDDFGNPNLRPEVKTDHEAGIDMIIRNRVQVLLTYARSNTRDAIIGIAVPSVTGYNTQEANVGSMRGEAYEATIEGSWIERKNFRWFSHLVLDRPRNLNMMINRPCYTDGLQNMCNGARLTDMWGYRLARGHGELRSIHANSQNQFQLNDEGFLVPVGVGNSWTEGLSKNLWGSVLTIDGVTYRWGEPFMVWDEQNQAPLFHKIGTSEPDLRFGFGNRINYKDFQLYFLVSGQLGGHVYNDVRQNLVQSLDAPEIVQVGKPDELKKPYYYYSRALTQSDNFFLKNFVESGTHAKLYEVQLAYSLDASRYRFLNRVGAQRMSLELIGRNLLTWTNYTGLRVEGGQPNERRDQSDYPIARNFSGAITLVF